MGRAPLSIQPWNCKQTARRAAAGAGIAILWGLPVLTWGQGTAPAPAPVAHTVSPARPGAAVTAADDFAGLKFTDDQRAQIALIRKDGKLRRDAVIKDEKLSPEQREAMLQGLERIERGQIYRVLTPEQQAEVRKRILARREAAGKLQQQSGQSASR